ncbi:exodeoxyribonuclease VII small subunit [Clostridium sp.]|uniref:exodeoxyribonuclease VII small subunit n=1 Tax=Clostridium sp. TaxID=1506 RepID=UPI002A90B851|nr:exodeoxyribonuclease VII small subunit [Clostridium sp.]MDY6011802.1 exodeoxyribonuclease VII small subunit [Clostridium sp.]
MARKVSYEDMLQNLRDILDDLENNELTLEEAMKEYEKGIKLINKLYKTLNEYEGKISIIKDNEEVELDSNNGY